MKTEDRRQKTKDRRQWSVVRVLILSSIFCLLSSVAFASQNYIQNVKVYKNSNDLRVKIDFSYPIKIEPTPSFYEKSIQFDIPDTYIHPAKRIFDIEDGLLKQIYTLQHSKDRVRLRLMLTQNGLDLKERLSVSKENNNLIISIKKSGVGSLESGAKGQQSAINPVFNTGQEAELPPVINKIEPDIKPVVNKVEGNNSETRNSNSNPNPDPESSSGDSGSGDSVVSGQTPKGDYLKYHDPVPTEPPDMSSAIIKTIAALAIVLAAVLIVSYIAKKLLKKNDMVFGKDKLIRVLGTSYIGVKKAITLLDVAGEVLVIGVSNNNITMLTKLESEEAKSRIQGVKGSRGQGNDFSYTSTPRTLESSNPALKDAMVAKITKTIQEKVRNLKRIQ